MSKKNANPYNVKCNYGKLFATWKTKQIITLPQLIAAGVALKMAESAAKASATVILSPRKTDEDCRGDCRGNFSAQGHLYFADKLKRKKGEVQRFRLRYRSESLEKRVRPAKEAVEAVEAVKVVKAKKTTKTTEAKEAEAKTAEAQTAEVETV